MNTEELFNKYECIPTNLKYMFIEKDFNNMFGKKFTQNKMRYLYDDSEEFIFSFDNALVEFTPTIRKNILKKYFQELSLDEHFGLYKSGMFYEFFPNLTGVWEKDKKYFVKFITDRELKKEYVNFILIGGKK